MINANKTAHQKMMLIRNTITHAVKEDIVLHSSVQMWTKYAGTEGGANWFYRSIYVYRSFKSIIFLLFTFW